MKQSKSVPQTVTNGLHRMLEEVMRQQSSVESLVAMMLEGKLKKKGVRLSTAEKQRLRDAAAEFHQTGNTSALEKAVTRRRKIRITLSARDIEKLERVFPDVVETAVTATARKFARSMEPGVLKWAEAASKWTRQVRKEFEERNARTWKDPFRRYAHVRELAQQVLELAIAHFGEKRLLETSRLAKAMLLLYTRACLVAGEVETLMRAGYADGAYARWRTLHEIAVTSSFLIERGEDAADRYLSHFVCEQLKAARSYEEHRQKLGYGPLRPKVLRDLEAEVDGLKQKYGEDFRHDYGWAAHALQKPRVNFSQIEEAVKLPFMRPFYRLASEQIHASSRGAIMRVGLIEQTAMDLKVLAGPSNYGFADAAMNSARALMLSAACLGQVDATLDMNVTLMILAKWERPLVKSFVKVQLGIERRDRLLAKRAKKRQH